ncbi:uncharacterized protein PHACADRAFT_249375 [Phanerochaete carnosa HHB-10118-sp]|uniref:Uncharacterized protein n=1 Tax=Phanerochaete carnosa (strain HHB-10118-sp) TaxID=650164 RepID=K5X8C1_PHACS|nr:uncharacterized protein PHACADRAFT_249375 [Phanerochaete carnosa HHB-10118-sp]EKM59132.1 hypothetical protein PHACADRAFT_249375 [Phanerochaete carnosa HHB-10118-sp]
MLDEDSNMLAVRSPPFTFYTGDSTTDSPVECFRKEGSSPHVAIYEPDLELHERSEATGDGAESENSMDEGDSGSIYGWSGNWTREFIERNRQRKPLGSLEKDVWEFQTVDNKRVRTWGAKVKLVPVAGSVVSQQDWHDEESMHAGKLRLISYRIRASVLEVYVRSDYLTSQGF